MNNGIVISSNSFFFNGALATINSIRRYNDYPISILNCGLDNTQKDKLVDIGVNIIDITKKLNKNLTQKREWHSDFSVYSSIFGYLSPYENILFLDADTIIFGSLSPFFSNLEGNEVVAVSADIISVHNKKKFCPLHKFLDEKGREKLQLDFPDVNFDKQTFNTGAFAIKSSFLKFLVEKYKYLFVYEKHFKFHDQTFLNLILEIEKKSYFDLGIRYNLTDVPKFLYEFKFSFLKGIYKRLTKKWRVSFKDNDVQFHYDNQKIIVLHYTGSPKPWNLTEHCTGKKIWNIYFAGHE